MSKNAVKMMTTNKPFPHQHLTGIDHLTTEDIDQLLTLADFFVVQNRRKSHPASLLKGKILCNLFFENSTRTKMSFDIAAKRLGAEVINLNPDTSSLKKGESFLDTLKTINALQPDIVVLRHGENQSINQAKNIMTCPIINAGNGRGEHPTQALLDALTLRRQFGKIEGLHIAICGDVIHSRVATSNALLLEKMGATITFIGPEELLPPNAPNKTTDLIAGLKNADAVMTLRIQHERIEKELSFTPEDYFNTYGLTREKLSHANKNCVILHPGPMNRGVEISCDLADDATRSLITTQVEMGVAVRMACLDLLTRKIR